MCDYAYHMEALRKQRVIERANAAKVAQGKSEGEKCDMQTYQPDPRRQDLEKLGGGAYGNRTKEEVRNAVKKDLWWRDRKLRDHNMYMGHMSAFEDLLPK